MRADLLAMLRDSVASPGEVARRLLALRLPTGRILEAAVLVSALDALILGLLGGGAIVLPLPGGPVTLGPLVQAALLAASLLLSASALTVGGRVLGGRGRFEDALALVVWLEVLAIVIQIVQVLVLLVLPPLADVVGLLGLAAILWCLVHFVRALHGFAGPGRAVLAVLLGALLVGLGLSLVLAALGLGVPADA